MTHNKRILFVCLGNICRSPAAEGIFRAKAEARGLKLEFDSAGTGGWHAGEAPDARMQKTVLSRGIDIGNLRARKFSVDDFDHFDLIYTMDTDNLKNVLKLARNNADRGKVKMLLNESFPESNKSVPDPYFGGQRGFDEVCDLIEHAADNVLKRVVNEQG